MTETVPDDVMKRIDAAVGKYGNQPVVTGIKMAMADVLKELVAEERERCALIAEMHDHQGVIAAAIRGTTHDH